MSCDFNGPCYKCPVSAACWAANERRRQMAWNNYDLKDGKDNTVSDNINHPKHYMLENGMETIDIIAGATAGVSGFEGYCLGNVIKYITRYKKKNGLEDLYKAQVYLKELIKINE